MMLARWRKQPSENRRYTIDYSRWLADGEFLSSAVTEVSEEVPAEEQALRDADPSREATVKVTVSGLAIPLPDQNTLTFFVSQGVDGVVAKVTLRVTTNDQQVREDEVEFLIDEV